MEGGRFTDTTVDRSPATPPCPPCGPSVCHSLSNAILRRERIFVGAVIANPEDAVCQWNRAII